MSQARSDANENLLSNLGGMEPVKRKWTRSPARLARYDSEREAIMKAAYRLVGRKSGPVSVVEVLESAGLSTRAFYRHFSSKDELVLTMYRTDNERVAQALWDATDAEPDAWRALQAWVDVSLAVAFDHGPERHSRVLRSAEVRSAAGWPQEFLDGNRRTMESLEGVLERGAREGTFRTVHIRSDAQVIFGATNHLVSLRLAGDPDAPDRQKALEIVLDAARRMLGADEDLVGASAPKRRASRPPSPTKRGRPPHVAGYVSGGGGSGSTSRARASRAARP